MDEHTRHTPVMPSEMPEPNGGWRNRWARRRAERAFARNLDTDSRQRAARQHADDRAAGHGEDPMPWPLRILAAFVAIVVLAVATVIAAVVVGAGVGFYDTHLAVKDISFAALGIATPLNLPTFTPLATEGLVWSTTLLAIVMVLLNRTATLWTRSMWAFASIAAFVNTWYAILDEHDLFGGVLRGSLSLAGPYLVHLFVLWCRHLRTGRTLAQARIDMEIRWHTIGKIAVAVLVMAARHGRHPAIALRAFGYWLGIDGWTYRAAWRAASIGYRRRVQERLNGDATKTAERHPAAAKDTTPAASSDAAEQGGQAPVDEDHSQHVTGGVLTAERPAFDPAELAEFQAALDDPGFTWERFADQPGQAAEQGGRAAADDGRTTRPKTAEDAAGPRPQGGRNAAGPPTGDGRKTTGLRLRPRTPRRPKQRLAGSSKAAEVDVTDLLPAAREVADELGARLRRDSLLKGLRERGMTVGGQRKKAIYDAVRAERDSESTGK